MSNRSNESNKSNWLIMNWPVGLAIAAAFSVIVANCYFLDPDLGWHIRVGEDLVKNHIFPRTDFYTFLFQGYGWRDHEWLAEGPLYLLYHYLGYPSLVVLFSVLWFLPFWWLIKEKNLALKSGAILVAVFIISSFMAVRLQVLTLIGLALLFRLFESYLPHSLVTQISSSVIPVLPSVIPAPHSVIPAKAGIQDNCIDSRLRGNDEKNGGNGNLTILSSRPCWRDLPLFAGPRQRRWPFRYIIKRLPRLRWVRQAHHRLREWLAMTNRFRFLCSGNKLLYLFPLIMLLWANLHGSFVYGLLVGFIFLVYCFTVPIKKNIVRPCGPACRQAGNYSRLLDLRTRSKNIATIFKNRLKAWLFLLSYLAGLALTLLNPYGIGLWQEIIIAADPAYKRMIAEWLPLLVQPINYYLAVYCLLFVVFAIVNRERRLPFPAYYLVSLFVFFILALISRRNVLIFVLLSLPVFIELLRVDMLLEGLKKRRLLITIFTIAISIALFSIYTLKLGVSDLNPRVFSGSYSIYPATNIIDELKKLPEGTAVFASYDFGGFLIQANPNIKVPMDGRASYWKLDGKLAIAEYDSYLKDMTNFNEARDRYRFETVLVGSLTSGFNYDLVSRQDLTDSLWQDFGINLLKSGRWRLVTKNDNNNQQLFVLKNSQSERLLLETKN